MSRHQNDYKNPSRNDETARGKRREFAVSLRKADRLEKMASRRDVPAIDPVELRNFLDNNPAGIQITALCPAIMNDEDRVVQFDALTKLRRLLATHRELPIKATIDSGVLPKLVEMLSWDHAPETQYEAAWVLTNVSSGTAEQTAAVVHEGAAEPLLRLLNSPVEKVKDQACWCLGNIAGDGPVFRDMLLRFNALEIFLQMLATETNLDLLRNVSWTISNFFRWKEHQVPIQCMDMALRHLAMRMDTQDQEVVSNICWAVCYIAETEESLLDLILEGFGTALMTILRWKEHDAQLPAIRTLGSISAGSDQQTEGVIDRGLLQLCPALLENRKMTVRKDTCWTISNICAGNYAQIDAVLRSGLVAALVAKCLGGVESTKVKLDAAWSLCNVFTQGNPAQADHMLGCRAVSAITEVMNDETMDARALTVFLEALKVGLERGEINRPYSGNVNVAIEEMAQHEGPAKLDKLMAHVSPDVSRLATKLLETYFHDDRIEGLQPQMANNGAYVFQAPGPAKFDF